MKGVRSPPAGAANDEISALIDTLHATGQRLEELTAGEVDGVTDSEGRTFLLRHTQEKLRHSEAAKQAAILNALPAHIALLDAQGIIISVNDAWRQFAATNALQGPQFGIGVDYLALCDSASGDGATEARQAAAGIRSVLASGAGAKSYSLEYPCHSPTQQRWFLMTATPFADAPPVGVVVMHLDVTERKLGEEALRRFVSALDAIADGIFLTDRRTMSFVHVNEAACRLTKHTRDALLALGPMRLLGKSRAEVEGDFDAIIDSGMAAEPLELLWSPADDAALWVELRRHAQWSGGRWTIVTMVRDITARKQAENRIRRLNRVYAVLSGINALIVRAADRDALFREACRIAVEDGGFRMAWIGLVDQAAMELVPVTAAGTTTDAATLVNQRFSLAEETPRGNALSATAIRDRVPAFTNDVPNDPRVVFKAEHVQRGSRSMAILPLLVSGDTVGVLALYAEEAGFFDEEELQLLTELAGDIGFAIDHLAKGARLNYLAYYDPLTGLANRSLFLERVAQHLRNAVAGGHKLAMFLIDLERFKNINDSLGRPAGDALLRLVAEWLTSHVEDASLLARVGADHFAVVLPEVKKDCDVARQLEITIEALVEHPFRLNDAVFRVAAKVGVALYPEDGTDADALFRNAEAALKRAKASGERYLFYTQTMTATAAASLSLENQLRQALDNHEFVLHYQPKVNLVSGKLVGAEALIRWNDPRTGLVPPIRFIPVLEEIGLIHEVGRWALHQAIADYLRWRAAGFAAVRIAVNVSPLQLRQRGFIAEVEQAIGVDAQAAAGLELEITESVIMEDIRHNIASLQAIRAMGVSIAIDDFGTGFSSLSYLSRLPIDTLKIDRSFVIDMTTGPQGLALVSTIIDLAHALKLKVVAEGVDTAEQQRLLLLLNCDEMQGYLFSKPLPVDVFEARYLAASSATAA